jgi:hypothetical protein
MVNLTLILAALMLIAVIPFASTSAAMGRPVSPAQSAGSANGYLAEVSPKEARFEIPVPQRARWEWHRSSTKDNAQEYRFDIMVQNGATEFTFGFYVWKRKGASEKSGNLSDLIRAGQKSTFETTGPRMRSLVPDADVEVRERGDRVEIRVKGIDNVARLFSERPPEVTVTMSLLDGTTITQKIGVNYKS